MTTDRGPSTTSVRLLGGHTWRGQRRLPRRAVLVSVIGGATLDLTEAEVPAEGATIVKVSLIGGLSVTVPAGVQVLVSGFTLFGGQRVDDPGATGPLLVLRTYGLMGGTRVRRAAV